MGDFILNVLKIFAAILLLPIVIASSFELYEHLGRYSGATTDFFFWGVLAFLLVYFFLYQFTNTYEAGQRLIENIFRFAAPVDQLMSKTVPFYLVLTMLSMYAVKKFTRSDEFSHYFIFFAGFSFALHILLTAQSMQSQESSALKPQYLFVITMICVSTIFVTVLLFDLNFGRFTFPTFFSHMLTEATKIYEVATSKVLMLR